MDVLERELMLIGNSGASEAVDLARMIWQFWFCDCHPQSDPATNAADAAKSWAFATSWWGLINWRF